MAKKKKKKHMPQKDTARQKQAAVVSKNKSKFPLLIMIAGGVLLLTGAFFLYQGQKPAARSPEPTQVKKANFNLRENRPTLSPEMFSGKVQKAYAIARAIPEVLDRLYCYCRCRENFGHKNLLSCYVDTHAST